MRVGYVRVSSADQNTVRQLDGIEVERTFTDKASGKDTARPKGQRKSVLATGFRVSRETVYSYLRTASVAGDSDQR